MEMVSRSFRTRISVLWKQYFFSRLSELPPADDDWTLVDNLLAMRWSAEPQFDLEMSSELRWKAMVYLFQQRRGWIDGVLAEHGAVGGEVLQKFLNSLSFRAPSLFGPRIIRRRDEYTDPPILCTGLEQPCAIVQASSGIPIAACADAQTRGLRRPGLGRPALSGATEPMTDGCSGHYIYLDWCLSDQRTHDGRDKHMLMLSVRLCPLHNTVWAHSGQYGSCVYDRTYPPQHWCEVCPSGVFLETMRNIRALQFDALWLEAAITRMLVKAPWERRFSSEVYLSAGCYTRISARLTEICKDDKPVDASQRLFKQACKLMEAASAWLDAAVLRHASAASGATAPTMLALRRAVEAWLNGVRPQPVRLLDDWQRQVDTVLETLLASGEIQEFMIRPMRPEPPPRSRPSRRTRLRHHVTAALRRLAAAAVLDDIRAHVTRSVSPRILPNESGGVWCVERAMLPFPFCDQPEAFFANGENLTVAWPRVITADELHPAVWPPRIAARFLQVARAAVTALIPAMQARFGLVLPDSAAVRAVSASAAVQHAVAAGVLDATVGENWCAALV
jgi:hypothetical protein